MAVSLTLSATTPHDIDHTAHKGSEHSGSPASLPPPTPLSPHHPYHSSNPVISRPGTADSSNTNTNNNNNTANQTTNSAAAAAANEKRKTSRRANTAERRATHNAVERQRRETLNGRFLDLAALLPNLTSVRRPSKSAIVNSSIALIHSQRRSRAIAARELGTLYSQFLALKAECDEWRARAGIPPVEEGERSAEWGVLMEFASSLKECELEMSEEEKGALRAAALASGGLGGVGGGGNGGEDDDDELLVGGGMEEDHMALPTPTSTDGVVDVHHHHQHLPAHHSMSQAVQHHHHHQVAPQHMHPQHPAAYVNKNANAGAATPAQIAHQQHLAQVHAAAQATLQYHQQQIQWQQQQQQQQGGRTRSATFSHHPQVQIVPQDLVNVGGGLSSPVYDPTAPSELFADSISILGGVPPNVMAPGAYHPHTHHHHVAAHHSHMGTTTPPLVNVKNEWAGYTPPSFNAPNPLPVTYEESVSSGSSASDVAQSPGATSSISGGAASPVAIMTAAVAASGRSRASSLNLGHGAPIAPTPMPVGGGGQGNIAMNMFY